MEVHGRQHDNTRDQLQRAGRDRIRHARRIVESVKDARPEAAERPSKGDTIELSSTAATAAKQAERAAERDSRIERLAQAMREGQLLTPERLERAAAKMLGA